MAQGRPATAPIKTIKAIRANDESLALVRGGGCIFFGEGYS